MKFQPINTNPLQAKICPNLIREQPSLKAFGVFPAPFNIYAEYVHIVH